MGSFLFCPVTPLTDGIGDQKKFGDYCSKMHPTLLWRILEEEEMTALVILNTPGSRSLMIRSLFPIVFWALWKPNCFLQLDTPRIMGFPWLSSWKLLILSNSFKNCSTLIVRKTIFIEEWSQKHWSLTLSCCKPHIQPDLGCFKLV